MKNGIIPILLWWTGKSQIEWNQFEGNNNLPSIVKRNSQEVEGVIQWTQHTMNELDILSLSLWDEFSRQPGPGIVGRIAEFYGFSPELESIDMYPIMIFINLESRKLILYSDQTKTWWSVEVDKKIQWIHPFESFSTQPETKTFSYRSFDTRESWSIHYFDAWFVRQPIVNTEGDRLWDMQIFSWDIRSPASPILH